MKPSTERKRLQTIKMLVMYGAKIDKKDHFGCDAIAVACESCNKFYLSSVLKAMDATEEQEIAAYELLGARILLTEDDMVKAMVSWEKAESIKTKKSLNVSDHEESGGDTHQPFNGCSAEYVSSLAHVRQLADDLVAMKHQAVLVVAKILGKCWRSYWDAEKFACAYLTKNLPLTLNAAFLAYSCYPGSSLLRPVRCLCLFLYRICRDNVVTESNVLLIMRALQRAVAIILGHLIETASNDVKAASSDDAKRRDVLEQNEEFINCTQTFRVHLASLLWIALRLPLNEQTAKQFRHDLRDSLVTADIRLKTCKAKVSQADNGLRLLHLAVADSNYFPTLADGNRFPSLRVVRFALYCDQGSVNSRDDRGNTPLHICARRLLKRRGIRSGSVIEKGNGTATLAPTFYQQRQQKSGLEEKHERLRGIALELLNCGAHWDCRGEKDTMAYELLGSVICEGRYMTLMCLSARVVVRHRIKYYNKRFPKPITDFLALH